MVPLSRWIQFGVIVAACLLSLAAWAGDLAAQPGTVVVYQAVLRNGFSIRHDHRQPVGAITRLYLAAGAGSGYVDVPTTEILSIEREEVPAPPGANPASRAEVEQVVNAASQQHRIDPDFIRSVIRAESGFNSRAVSPKGAQGLMQLMPGTSAQLGVNDAFAPSQNIDAGTRYLRQLLVLYNNDMIKALAAYNAGPERVARYGGVPPFRETHAYVARVIRDFNRHKLAERQSASLPTRADRKKTFAAKTVAARQQVAATSAGTP